MSKSQFCKAASAVTGQLVQAALGENSGLVYAPRSLSNVNTKMLNVGSAWALPFIWRAPQAQHSQKIPLESDSNLTFELKLSQDIGSFRLDSSLTIHTCFWYRSFWDTIQFQVGTNYHFLLYKTHQPIKRRRHMSNVGTISN